MCFGKSEIEIFSIQIALRQLLRNKEISKTHRKGEYDIVFTVTWAGQEVKAEPVDVQTKITADGKDYEIDVIEITNLFQPFKEDNQDEAVVLKSSTTVKYNQMTSTEKKRRTTIMKKEKAKKRKTVLAA